VAAAGTAVVLTVDHGVEENSMHITSMKAFEMKALLAHDEAIGSMQLLTAHLIAAVVFSIVGIVVFLLCLLLMEKLTHFSLVKEIGEEHNQAVAMVVSAIVLGISIIIAASVFG
jgi:ABC-type iron transport system FetAB permease component